MQCPQHDGELDSHTAQGERNLAVSYATCPTCRGYWMDSFAANFIKPSSVDGEATATAVSAYFCPVCAVALVRTTGDNVPEGVFVFDCPNHHGYFFPTGQLAAFKKAQNAKISYHKLWHIPMPNVSAILLGGFILLVLTGGLAATLTNLNQQQTTEFQAQELLTGHAAYVSADKTSVLLTATTAADVVLTVHIPELNNFSTSMKSADAFTHSVTIPNIPAGTYQYYFVVKTKAGETTSEIFTFSTR